SSSKATGPSPQVSACCRSRSPWGSCRCSGPSSLFASAPSRSSPSVWSSSRSSSPGSPPQTQQPATSRSSARCCSVAAAWSSSPQASAQWPRLPPWCYSQPTPQQTPQQASPSPSSPNDRRSPRRNTTMASLSTLRDGITLTHFIVAQDVERASRFYSDVLGGE